jgi:hypothetical protein
MPNFFKAYLASLALPDATALYLYAAENTEAANEIVDELQPRANDVYE